MFVSGLPCLCFSFSKTANLNVSTLSSHQMHLFDIDVPGKICFQESETLSPGCELAKLKTGIHLHVHVLQY